MKIDEKKETFENKSKLSMPMAKKHPGEFIYFGVPNENGNRDIFITLYQSLRLKYRITIFKQDIPPAEALAPERCFYVPRPGGMPREI